MNEQLDAEQLHELMNEGAPPVSSTEEKASPLGPIKEIPIPAVIWVTFDDRILGFDAPGKNGWAYAPMGVFATGYWLMEAPEDQRQEDVLIPYSQLHHITFDFPTEEKEDDGADTSD